jgi:hypothetical protein
MLMYPRGAANVQCAVCGVVNSAQQVRLLRCADGYSTSGCVSMSSSDESHYVRTALTAGLASSMCWRLQY